MPKGKPDGRVRTKVAIKPARERTPTPERRQRAPAEGPKTAKRPRRSDAALLAAEVERLEQQLAAARKQLAALEARADIDPLTELPNRRGFERELKRSLAYVKRYGASAALLYLDLDGFKRSTTATATPPATPCSGRWRGARPPCARIRCGGAHRWRRFVLLLWNCDEADARQGAGLEAAIGRTTATHAGVALAVGASCGAALLLPLDEPADAIERADRAMYARKAARSAAQAADATVTPRQPSRADLPPPAQCATFAMCRCGLSEGRALSVRWRILMLKHSGPGRRAGRCCADARSRAEPGGRLSRTSRSRSL